MVGCNEICVLHFNNIPFSRRWFGSSHRYVIGRRGVLSFGRLFPASGPGNIGAALAAVRRG
jgi:hypothetical protein